MGLYIYLLGFVISLIAWLSFHIRQINCLVVADGLLIILFSIAWPIVLIFMMLERFEDIGLFIGKAIKKIGSYKIYCKKNKGE